MILLLAALSAMPEAMANPTRRSVPGADCNALIFPRPLLVATNSEPAQRSHLPDDAAEAIRQRGPLNQELAVRLLNGEIDVFGTRKGLERARLDLGDLKPILARIRLPNFVHQGVRVREALGLSGSAVERAEFGDLDLEMTLVASAPGVTEADLHRPDSAATQALVKYLQTHVEQMSAAGFLFSDFKAGEYDSIPDDASAQRTKSRAIKWNRAEMIAGEKRIRQTGGNERVITLAAALAQESRVKIDWIGRVPMSSALSAELGITHRYVEHSILFVFGAQNGNNQPVIRLPRKEVHPEVGATGGHLAVPGYSNLLPLRVTTAFFTAEELRLARDVSVSAPPPDLRWINVRTLMTAQTNWQEGKHLKVIKRLLSRFNFWNDVELYNQHRLLDRRPAVREAQLEDQMRAIVDDPLVSRAHHLADIGEGLRQAKIKGATIDRVEELRFIAMTMVVFEKHNIRLDSQYLHRPLDLFIEQLNSIAETRARVLLNSYPESLDYIEFVMRAPYADSYRLHSGQPIFVSFTLPVAARKAYREWLTSARRHYSKLQFTPPEDLHMTVAYAGSMADDTESRFFELYRNFAARLHGIEWQFQSPPRLEVIGQTNSQLALVFNADDVPSEVKRIIQDFKVAVGQLGVRLDRHAGEFLPHISIAHTAGVMRDSRSHLQLHRMLSETTEIPGFMSLRMSGKSEVLAVTNPSGTGRRYQVILRSGESPIAP